jgi:hypothetical protein
MQPTVQPRLQPSDQPRRRRGAGRPFPKGVSGNPSGSKQPKRYLEILGCVLADLGVGGLGELSGLDRLAVEQVVQQLRRAERAKDHAEAARCSRTAQQWLKDLQGRRAKREPSGPSLREYLAKKAFEGTGS